MKHVKMLSLAAVAALASMAFAAGPASATILEGAGGAKLNAGAAIHAEAEESLNLHAGFSNITCTEATVEGSITNAGGSSSTVSGSVNTMTGGGCGENTIEVITKGSWEIHHIAGTANGTLTSNGATATITRSGVHCLYATSNTDIGKLTGSTTTGSTATLDIEATLTREATSFLCASNASLTGKFKITNPDTLNVTAS